MTSKGGTVVAVYSDEGIGAYKKTVRPDFERILNDLEVGHIEGLAAWKLDRLTRNQEDLSRLWDMIQKSGAVLACAPRRVRHQHAGRRVRGEDHC